MKHCLQPCVLAMINHLQENDCGNEFMRTSYVSTDVVESGFGKLDQTNCQSQRVDIWKILGRHCVVPAGYSWPAVRGYGEKLTAENRRTTRRWLNLRPNYFFYNSPFWVAMSWITRRSCTFLYSAERIPRAYFANIGLQKTQQIQADLSRKEAHVVGAERAQSKALKCFMDKRNYTLYVHIHGKS